MEYAFVNEIPQEEKVGDTIVLLKKKLNDTRNGIDSLRKRNLEKWWSTASYLVNPYEMVETLDTSKHSSRAYFKMYEIFRKYKLLDETNVTYRSLHLCEAPGGFVEATVDICKRFKVPHQWYAVTLPTGLSWKSSLKDSVIYADVIKDTLPSCVYQVDLVTGDGGFEVKDFNNQETLNHSLLNAQIEKTFTCLKIGGHMVIKMFDMFEHETCNLLWKCFQSFECLFLYKPRTSRICNSEKYIIGKNFKGTQFKNMDVDNNSILPIWFIKQIETAATQFTTLQTESITYALNVIDEKCSQGLSETQFNNLLKDSQKIHLAKQYLKWLYK